MKSKCSPSMKKMSEFLGPLLAGAEAGAQGGSNGGGREIADAYFAG